MMGITNTTKENLNDGHNKQREFCHAKHDFCKDRVENLESKTFRSPNLIRASPHINMIV
jgi:hypothetical protein